jgi:beta-glucanase (GH16 family)
MAYFSGNNFGATSGKVQINYFGKGMIGNYDRRTQPMVGGPRTEFHTYALDWGSASLKWSCRWSGNPYTSKQQRKQWSVSIPTDASGAPGWLVGFR